jgi:hydroxymethylbilane synthase
LRKIRIGTRGSRLGLVQVEETLRFLGEVEHEILTFDTSGDIDRKTPVSEVEGTDFFTDSIERALLKGEIDMAVHSAKDLPDSLPEALTIAAVTKSIDEDDVLASKGNLTLRELFPGAKVGTSSKRRKEALRKIRPDLQIVDLRGNVEERIKRLDKGEFDAIVIAAAGLIRLGLEDRISERLPFETARGQGSLAIEIRQGDSELKKWIKEKFI